MERRFTQSLRFKVTVGVALPVFLLLAALSAIQYLRERQLLLERLEESAIRLGEVMRGGLRQAMLSQDQERLRQMLRDISSQESVLLVAIVNERGEVRAAEPAEGFHPAPDRSSPGCVDCHRPSGTLMRHSLIVSLPGEAPVLRSSILIPNEPACYACHKSTTPYLGVLIADFSLSDLERESAADLRLSLGLAVLATVFVTSGVYLLVHHQVVRRVERFQTPLRQFALGDFSERVRVQAGEQDELGELAGAVNRMAEGLSRQAELERRAREARQEAIVEERQRLARELHDGVAQVLGYVNTKAMAARLLLRRGETAGAADQLRQLEEAARGVFVDLRQAILDLKTTVNGERGFLRALEQYVERFREQSGISTDLVLGEGMGALELLPESEVHLLRIIQEALTNVRKHAAAAHAWVRFDLNGGRAISLTVGDDGRGFDPAVTDRDRRPHFGLHTMRERAEAVGGTFAVTSTPGGGTRVVVTLPLSKGESHSNDDESLGRG
ncbi:MAG: HAMP domain-containing protein [Chloroflexi bacterium]|nr:HAMP domain-containing protein [Chloroflexota bacterium]